MHRRPSPVKGQKPRSSSSDRANIIDAMPSKPIDDTHSDVRTTRRSSQHLDSKGSRKPESHKRTSARRPSGDHDKVAEKRASKGYDSKAKTLQTDLATELAMMTPVQAPSSPTQAFHSSILVLSGLESPSRSSPRRNPSRRPRRLSSMAPVIENIDLPDEVATSSIDCSNHSSPAVAETEPSQQRLSQSLHSSPRRRVSRISRFNKAIPENGKAELEMKPSSVFESKLLKAKESNKKPMPCDNRDQAIPAATTRERIVTVSELKETVQSTEEQEGTQPEIDNKQGTKHKKSKNPRSKSRESNSEAKPNDSPAIKGCKTTTQ